MSKEFTDGPWHYGGGHTDVSGDVLYVGEITAAGSNYRGEIATVQSCDHIPNGISRDEAKANIRLIAAAPELLEALRDLLEAAESMRGTYGHIAGETPEHEDAYTHDKWAEEFLQERAEVARAAIAKAKGQ